MSYPKIWVIEGPDNSGKTTFAQRLAKKLGGIYVKGEYVRQPEIEVIRLHTWLRASPGSRLIICDRHPVVSDPIYGTVVRKEQSLLSPGFCSGMSQYYNMVYCRPPRDKILDFGDREQMAGVIDEANDLIDAYDLWWQEQKPKLNELSRLEYDWTLSPTEFDRLAEYIRRSNLVRQPESEVCPHAAPFRYCPECVADPCPVGLGRRS